MANPTSVLSFFFFPTFFSLPYLAHRNTHSVLGNILTTCLELQMKSTKIFPFEFSLYFLVQWTIPHRLILSLSVSFPKLKWTSLHLTWPPSRFQKSRIVFFLLQPLLPPATTCLLMRKNVSSELRYEEKLSLSGYPNPAASAKASTSRPELSKSVDPSWVRQVDSTFSGRERDLGRNREPVWFQSHNQNAFCHPILWANTSDMLIPFGHLYIFHVVLQLQYRDILSIDVSQMPGWESNT